MNLPKLLSELKRRPVFKIVVVCLIVGLALAQLIVLVFPIFDIPNWVVRLFVLLIILGLALILISACFFEVIPEGIKSAKAFAFAQSPTSGRAWIYITAIVGALSIGLFLLGSNTAEVLSNIGDLFSSKGYYTKAELLYQRALKIREKSLGVEHLEVAENLLNLADVYYDAGDYGKAEPLLQHALKIDEKALGPEHPGITTILNDLGWTNVMMGNYTKAKPFLERALRIDEKAFGPANAATAQGLDVLGQYYREVADYARAEPLLQRALKIREKTLGPEHYKTGVSLNSLADLYRYMGDYTKAEPLFQAALRIDEKQFGPAHPNTAGGLSNLATLYQDMGNYAKAEPLFQRALRIEEKSLGAEHPGLAITIHDLALSAMAAKDYAKAEPLLQRALAINQKALGPEHPETALEYGTLGKLYWQRGDYARAEPLDQHALNIAETLLGPRNRWTGMALDNLAVLKIAVGDYKEALELATQSSEAQEATLSNILSFTSEQQRLAYQKTEVAEPYNLFATLGSASNLAKTILRQKGVVLDSLLEDKLVNEASTDPKQHEMVTELRGAKERLMQLQLQMPMDVSEEALKKRETEKLELSQKVEGLEAGLARQVAGLGRARRALSVTVPQVQAVLTKSETLIEFVHYSHVNKDEPEPRYGAVVIPSKGDLTWIPLGAAKEIEQDVQLYQKSARGQTDEPTLSSVLHRLYERIWMPIEKALPAEARTVIISPDGELNFVSFATFIGSDDKFVAEKYSVRYVASGRDLLRPFNVGVNSQTSVYADPDFGTNASQLSPAIGLRSIEIRDLQNISLAPLPGTAAEAEALHRRFGNAAKLFLGADATKAQLQQVDSPHILHLATHGFFLPEIALPDAHGGFQREENIPRGRLVNPMHRSGLALAGAQTTLQAWGRGEAPPIENNGILTAEEVGGLRLEGTWLVVLSACDTGLGEVRAGEGVLGLRRGFIQAGAQNLLMTLWTINDQTTVQIMLDFYDAAEKTHDAPRALANVQRDWLVKVRKQRGLMDAVRLAGAFIMSSQGKQ